MDHTQRSIVLAGSVYLVAGVGLAAVSLWPEALRAVDAAVAPGSGLPDRATQLFAAVAGGLTAGLGAMLIGVGRALHDGPRGAARGLLAGLLVWFTVDTMGSLAHGSWQNAVGNTLFLLVGLVPLARAASTPPPTARPA